MNSFFHRCVHQDSVREQAFLINDRRDIASIMKHRWLQKKWLKFNPTTHIPGIVFSRHSVSIDVTAAELLDESLDSEEMVQQLEKAHTIVFTDLSLLYRVSDTLGWYKTQDDYCYYVEVTSFQKKTFHILYARLTVTQLEFLIQQVCVKGVGEA